MTNKTYSTTATGGVFGPGFLDRVKTYLARSRAQRQLYQLDDRMLADIGINRSEIRKMVWGN